MHERLYNLLLRRGIVIQTAEIYNPPAGFYDYGPVGARIKRRIVDLWRRIFLSRPNFYEMDGCTILPEAVLKASGHADHFHDPLVECAECHRKFRADHMVEEALSVDASHMSMEDLDKLFKEKEIKCPVCGGRLGGVKPFSLMFETYIGPVGGVRGYARPETAQNIFLSFHKVFLTHGAKLPMAIAQVGRAYRNEISPRQGLIRLREFTQMEIEYFFDPEEEEEDLFEEAKEEYILLLTRKDQEDGKKEGQLITVGDAYRKDLLPLKTLGYFMALERRLMDALGIRTYRIRHLMEDETPHYSGGNFDLEIPTRGGWVEVISLAYRTNYDLVRHSQFSGRSLEVTANGKKVLPHVVEPSIGLDRLFWCTLEHAYKEDRERGWDWLDLPPRVAPYDGAVFPLMRKDGLPEKAKAIRKSISASLDVFYSEAGSVGKRYAKADEIGIPYCITVDYQTLEDDTVTVRFRNDAKQVRVPVDKLVTYLTKWRMNGITSAKDTGLSLQG